MNQEEKEMIKEEKEMIKKLNILSCALVFARLCIIIGLVGSITILFLMLLNHS